MAANLSNAQIAQILDLAIHLAEANNEKIAQLSAAIHQLERKQDDMTKHMARLTKDVELQKMTHTWNL